MAQQMVPVRMSNIVQQQSMPMIPRNLNVLTQQMLPTMLSNPFYASTEPQQILPLSPQPIMHGLQTLMPLNQQIMNLIMLTCTKLMTYVQLFALQSRIPLQNQFNNGNVIAK